MEALHQLRGLEGDGGQRGKGVERRCLVVVVTTGVAVRDQECSDHTALDVQGRTEDRPYSFGADRLVDGRDVVHALVGQIVAGGSGHVRVGDGAEDARAERHAQGAVGRSDDTVRGVDVRLFRGVVVEAQVRHVRADDRARTAHDRADRRFAVALGRDLEGRLVDGIEQSLP